VGSVLLLFPAAVLVVMILAAITVDASVAFQAQREVADATAAAANDAAGESVGNQAFYRGGRVDVDRATAEAVAVERVRAALDPQRFRGLSVSVSVVGGDAGGGCPPLVRVRAAADVSFVFAAVIPGAPHHARVAATSLGSPRGDAGPGAC
jgi:Flp pilus assembly protein TadG